MTTRTPSTYRIYLRPMSTLSSLVADLAAGRLRVVDLTQPLGPETPVIGLPPIFAPSPGVDASR